MRKKVFIAIMTVCVVFIYLYRFLMSNRGFNTFYDEAFFLLALQDANDGVINGASQWNLLAVNLIPFVNLTNKTNAYIVNLCISLTVVILLSIITTYLHIIKHGTQNRAKVWLFYFLAYSLASMFFLYDNQELDYVSLQSLFFAVALSLFVISRYCRELIIQRLCVLLLGIVSILSVFVILPSGVCLMLCWASLIIVMRWKDVRGIIVELLFFSIGVLLGLALFHFCVADLACVIEQMRETANNITSLNRGYDFYGFLVKIMLFIRDVFMGFVTVIGVWYLKERITDNLKIWKWLGDGLFLIVILLVFIYQKMPTLNATMLCMAIASIPLFSVLTNKKRKIEINKKHFFLLFLFVFPLIASLGTNLYIGKRIGCFVFSWILLYEEMYNDLKVFIHKSGILVLSFFVVVMFSQVLKFKSWEIDKCVFQLEHKHTTMSDLYLKSDQVSYLDKAIDIFGAYNFNQDSSLVFGFNESFAAIYVVGAKNHIIPYGIEDFLYDSKYLNVCSPDFIIIPQRFLNEVKDSDRCRWDWEDYDVYELGTPNTIDGMDTNQLMYCKKQCFTNKNGNTSHFF